MIDKGVEVATTDKAIVPERLRGISDIVAITYSSLIQEVTN
jgi:hypothetical protein